MSALDLAGFRATPLARDPFDHVIHSGFILRDALPLIHNDFPEISRPGSFPLPGLRYGPAFANLMAELQGPEITKAFSDKFEMDLTKHPTMITVRGRARARDGGIHTDSQTKLITVLIYMNGAWEHTGGRLRLLHSPDSLDNMVAEVPPNEGTLIAFRNSANAWHGHASVEGPRRAIQLNWVTDESVVRHEQKRHAFSAFLKRLNPFS